MKTIAKPLVMANQWTIVLAVIVALITQSAWILLIPLLTNLSSLLFGFHPVLFIIKKLFLRKPISQYIQEDYEQLRFNQWLAVFFLSSGTISDLMNWSAIFNIATIMVGIAAAIAIMGFCIGCFMRFQYQQWKYRRRQKTTII